MARVTKSATEKPTFLTRFRDLVNEKGCSQVQLANAIGVQRSTVATWLDGRTAPNAYMVKALAEYFSVSADYLLCISDTRSADVNVKAAMAYTGLSEKAVESLHNGYEHDEMSGFLDTEVSDDQKRANLGTVSTLLSDEIFETLVHYLNRIEKNAYLEMAVLKLHIRYPRDDDPAVDQTQAEARTHLAERLIQELSSQKLFDMDTEWDDVEALIKKSVEGDVSRIMLAIRERNNHNQYLASKTLDKYMDQIVDNNHKIAGQFLNRVFEKQQL